MYWRAGCKLTLPHILFHCDSCASLLPVSFLQCSAAHMQTIMQMDAALLSNSALSLAHLPSPNTRFPLTLPLLFTETLTQEQWWHWFGWRALPPTSPTGKFLFFYLNESCGLLVLVFCPELWCQPSAQNNKICSNRKEI